MTTEQTTSVQYEIPTHKVDELHKIVTRVAKRAAKLNLPAITFATLSTRPCRVYRIDTAGYDGESLTYRYVAAEDAQPTCGTEYGNDWRITTTEVGATTLHTVEITGAEPYIDGHHFLASVDHGDADETNIVSCVPGIDAPEGLVAAWLNAPADCAHCGLNRRRLNTYLLLKDTGETVQVGSTCLKDYFPGHAAEDIAALANLWIVINLAATGGDDDFEGQRSSGGSGGWLREAVLAVAAANIREHGWVSKALAGNSDLIATANRVADDLSGRKADKFYTPAVVLDEDIEKAEAVIAWIDAVDPYTHNEYLCNLRSACGRKVTAPRHLGLVVSAVGSYERDEQKRIERAAVDSRSIPVPITGVREQIVGTVISTKVVDGYYGSVVKVLINVDRPEGTFRLWGTLPGNIFEAHAGDTLSFVAKIATADWNDDESFGEFKIPKKAELVPVSQDADECATVAS